MSIMSNIDIESAIIELNSITFIATRMADAQWSEFDACVRGGFTVKATKEQLAEITDGLSYAIYHTRRLVLDLQEKFYGEDGQ